MADAIEFEATAREHVGKGAAKRTRDEGLLPAVIYGDKKPPEPISVHYKEIWKQVQTGHFLSTVYTVNLDGKKTRVIPRDIQLDPVRDFPLHVDFLRLGKGATITVAIPVNFINDEASPGLKRGGVLNIVRHDIDMSCPADKIPESIEVDLSGLDIGDSVHISAVTLPDGITPTITDRDFTIASVAGSSASSSEADETGEEEEESTEPTEGGEE